MSVTVYISGHLKPFSNGQVEINLAGEFATVGDVLDLLCKLHPALRDRVLTETGEIRRHVNIFAGSDDVKRLKGLATNVKDRDIHIFNAISGG